MSQQSTPMEASCFGIDAVRRFKAAIARAATAFQNQRQAHANRVVRSIVVRHYSDADLAGYGWSAEDIRRIKSK